MCRVMGVFGGCLKLSSVWKGALEGAYPTSCVVLSRWHPVAVWSSNKRASNFWFSSTSLSAKLLVTYCSARWPASKVESRSLSLPTCAWSNCT